MQDAKTQIIAAIKSVKLSPESVAKADADICRSIGREVERAVRIANETIMYKSSGPVWPENRLACARLTQRWEGLSDEAQQSIAAAILATDSYEAAAQMILDVSREGV